MSGHSKWSKVKHQKATTDVAKAAAFTRASRAITVAVLEGGGLKDPEFNFRLRLAIEKAKDVNMPSENIKRAIEKAAGESAGSLKQEAYEGYGPFGVAFYVEAATDNTNRTVSFIKQTLEHAGGSMGAPGSVGYLFERLGLLLLAKNRSFDEAYICAMESGAQDVIETEDVYEMYCELGQFATVQTSVKNAGFTIESSRVIMKPTVLVELSPDKSATIDTICSILEEHQDIQQVFTNAQ